MLNPEGIVCKMLTNYIQSLRDLGNNFKSFYKHKFPSGMSIDLSGYYILFVGSICQ